jgi:D-alanyl-D-alanine endopeptidase (penicillin-binding protein 7)
MEAFDGIEDSLGIPFSHRLPVPAQESGFGPTRIPSDSLGILTKADSAIIIDERTWSVLYEKAPQDVRPIASITKLMTALVLLDYGMDMSADITVSRADYRLGGLINVFSGEVFTTQDIWMVGLIASDNVAISALVRSTGLSEEEFVRRMNAKALELGMHDSAFVEPTGIESGNVSTANDLTKLVAEAMSHVQISDAVRRPFYRFEAKNKPGVRTAQTTNVLLKSFVNEDPYEILGGKTGFINEAGYCLSLVVDGPNEADNVIVILLGADTTEDRFQEVKGLVDWVYANFRW